MTVPPRRPTRRRALALVVAIAALAAACGSSDDTPAGGNGAAATPDPTDADTADTDTADADTADADTTVAPASPDTIPPGITLRVGDQGGGLEIPLRLSGELDDVPYDIEFASFASGPLANEAFSAGAIDIGIMGDTPALLSYASGLDTVVVGIRASDGVAMTLVARPDSGIETLADLEGRKVAFTTGSNQHGFVLRALDSIGLRQGDIDHVDVPLSDVVNVLAAGSADAAVLYEAFRPPYLDEHPGAVELVTLRDFTRSYLYLLGLRNAVEDPGKAAAIEDFVTRLARSGVWVDEHPDEFIQAYYVDGQKQTPEYGRQAFDAQGFTEWVEIGGDALVAQQDQADLLHDAGFLPDPVDVAPQFDPAVTARFSEAALAVR